MTDPASPRAAGRTGRCRRSLLAGLRRDSTGASALEFALGLPLLMLFFGGVIDFGYALYTQASLSQAAREAARQAAVHSAASASPMTAQAVETTARGWLRGVGSGVTVSVAYAPSSAPGGTVSVSLAYSYRFALLPLSPLSLSGFASMTISN